MQIDLFANNNETTATMAADSRARFVRPRPNSASSHQSDAAPESSRAATSSAPETSAESVPTQEQESPAIPDKQGERSGSAEDERRPEQLQSPERKQASPVLEARGASADDAASDRGRQRSRSRTPSRLPSRSRSRSSERRQSPAKRGRSRSWSRGSSRSRSYSRSSRSYSSYSRRSDSRSASRSRSRSPIQSKYRSRSRSPRYRSVSRSRSRSRSPPARFGGRQRTHASPHRFRNARYRDRRSRSRSRTRSPIRNRSRPKHIVRSVCVAPLTPNVGRSHLTDIFMHFGRVISIDIFKQAVNHVRNSKAEHAGKTMDRQIAAYIEFDNVRDLDEAVECMHGGMVDGQTVSVTELSVEEDQERIRKGRIPDRRAAPHQQTSNRGGDGPGSARGGLGGIPTQSKWAVGPPLPPQRAFTGDGWHAGKHASVSVHRDNGRRERRGSRSRSRSPRRSEAARRDLRDKRRRR